MRLSKDVRQCVVFLGWETSDPAEPFKPVGTGFLLEYKENVYIVTARHVALEFGEDPFSMRLNTTAFPPRELIGPLGETEGYAKEWQRRAQGLHVDPLMDGSRWYSWFPELDLAVMPFNKALRDPTFDHLLFPEENICTHSKVRSEEIGVGDFCYTVGLFRHAAGKNRNTPIVHTGHIAMMPSGWDKISVRDWNNPNGDKRIEIIAYLVESQSLKGLSGAPVLVRPTVQITMPTSEGAISTHVPKTDFYLLGVWHGTWEGVPDSALPLDRKETTRVPVGTGIVIPAEQLVALLESPELREQREIRRRELELSRGPIQ